MSKKLTVMAVAACAASVVAIGTLLYTSSTPPKSMQGKEYRMCLSRLNMSLQHGDIEVVKFTGQYTHDDGSIRVVFPKGSIKIPNRYGGYDTKYAFCKYRDGKLLEAKIGFETIYPSTLKMRGSYRQ